MLTYLDVCNQSQLATAAHQLCVKHMSAYVNLNIYTN